MLPEFPTPETLKLEGKSVLVRMDLDVDVDSDDIFRLESGLKTLVFLAEKQAEILIIGHKGRPNGKENPLLSLKPVAEALDDILKKKLGGSAYRQLNMHMLENLRFNIGEEKNTKEFAESLAMRANFFINEAFSDSHREHASIVGLPKLLPSALGFHFLEEIKVLGGARDNPKRPLLVIVSGVKEDKLDYLEPLAKLVDKVVVAGRLPHLVEMEEKLERKLRANQKLMMTKLTQDNEDITINSMEKIEAEIEKAGTIVVNGPVGKFEEEGHRQGTERVFKSVAESKAFKVAGGGDTIKAIKMFKLEDRFDWLSVGGGAMLEFLTKRTLPGIEAVKKDSSQ